MATSKYTAGQIACYFINKANKDYIDEETPEGITNLKLQKLLYFAQAAHVSTLGKPLFDDEIQAWKYGPVVPTVYRAFKKFGNRPIEQQCAEKVLPDDLKSFLQSIWDIYGKYSASELVQITHNHGPWKETFLKGKSEEEVITVEALEEYYKGYFTDEE